MKKVLAMLLCLTMILGCLVGCAKTETKQEETKQAETKTEEKKTETKTEEKKTEEKKNEEPAKPAEPIKLNWISLTGAQDSSEGSLFESSPVFQKLVEETGVWLTSEGVDADRAKVLLAGGDTTDLLTYRNAIEVQNSIEGGQLLPLNELIEQYAPNIAELAPERLDMAKRLFGDADGNFYALPVNAGPEGPSGNVGRYIYVIRWDLYAEMGYPEVKNLDDMLALLADMQAKYPTTLDGEKVWGTGFAVSNGKTIGFDQVFCYSYGFRTASDYVMIRVSDNSLVYDYTDEGSPFWMAAEYYNKAYRMGLLDPDSLTMQEADYKAKANKGVYLSPNYRSYGTTYANSVKADHPEIGFEGIPVEGITYWTNSNQIAGWEQNYIAIPTTCKDPEAMIKFLDYVFGYEGSRLVKSGVEGINYTIENGDIIPTPETIAALKAGGDDQEKTGVRWWNNLCGLGDYVRNPDDGAILGIYRCDTYQSNGLTGADIAFSEHFGVALPFGKYNQMIKEGKAFDHSGLDMRLVSGLGAAPEDIARIDASLENIAANSIAKLVMAEDDAAFAAAKAELLKDLEDAGAATARAWWQARLDEVKAEFGVK